MNNPAPGTQFVSPFIDAACNSCIFMWDSVFMLMFGKYAHHIFNFQQTLDNFYAHQHQDGFISREIAESDSSEMFTRHDPSSTEPNVMPWCEWEYYLLTGDKDRIRAVFPALLGYHRWLRQNRTWPGGGYFSSGWGCGMDNLPRLMDCTRDDVRQSFDHGHMIWFEETGTLWESYAPEQPGRGSSSSPDFVGWSGIFPITTLFEYAFGIEARAEQRELVWHISLTDEFGVQQLSFGLHGMVDLHCEAREHRSEKPVIRVRSDEDLTPIVRWDGQEERLAVKGTKA